MAPRVLFLSNGHGEDAIGSRLAMQLRDLAPELELIAYPLVGSGAAWRAAGLAVAGPARSLPSAGLTFHSAANFAADLRAGLLPLTVSQLRGLRHVRADAVVVVGDIWALANSLFSGVSRERRFVLQTLVSVRSAQGRLTAGNRLFMERLTGLERLLQRRYTARVWLRDVETATALQRSGVRQAAYAGSFLFDSAPAPLPADGHVLLLPGSRAVAADSLDLLLQAALLLPDVPFSLAWAGDGPPAVPGWQLQGSAEAFSLSRAGVTVPGSRGTFHSQLAGAVAAVGTTGTALEEAVAAGRPALTFALGSRHTAGFVRNQVRLLQGGLSIAEAEPEALAAGIRQLLRAGQREVAAAAGARVLGRPGGLSRIAAELAERLSVS